MPSKIKDKTFQSKQVGTRESKEVNMEGRVQFDVMQAWLHRVADWTYTVTNMERRVEFDYRPLAYTLAQPENCSPMRWKCKLAPPPPGHAADPAARLQAVVVLT